MNFEDALQLTVTRKDAIREIEKHGCDPEEFFQEVGDRPTYKGKTILYWLGY
mgnify:CR=1 FL=1